MLGGTGLKSTVFLPRYRGGLPSNNHLFSLAGSSSRFFNHAWESMLHRLFSSTRYIVLIPIIGTFVAAVGLMVYEAIFLTSTLIDIVYGGAISPKDVKTLAVGVIEAVDIFLIGIAIYMISIGLFTLFVDDTLPLPRWLIVQDFEDVKANLVSVVIAVLAVLFLREAVAWNGERDILGFGSALALVIAALSLYLGLKKGQKT